MNVHLDLLEARRHLSNIEASIAGAMGIDWLDNLLIKEAFDFFRPVLDYDVSTEHKENKNVEPQYPSSHTPRAGGVSLEKVG